MKPVHLITISMLVGVIAVYLSVPRFSQSPAEGSMTVVQGERPGEVVFVFTGKDGDTTGIQIGLLIVRHCTPDTSKVWMTYRAAEGPLYTRRMTYGVVSSDRKEDVSAVPLTPGCYAVRIVGNQAMTRFSIDSLGRVLTPRDPEWKEPSRLGAPTVEIAR